MGSEALPRDFRVEEVVPPLSALFSVSANREFRLQLVRNLLPLFGSLDRDNPEELIIFSFGPLSLSYRGFVALVPLILALGIIPSWDEVGYVHPI